MHLYVPAVFRSFQLATQRQSRFAAMTVVVFDVAAEVDGCFAAVFRIVVVPVDGCADFGSAGAASTSRAPAGLGCWSDEIPHN